MRMGKITTMLLLAFLFTPFSILLVRMANQRDLSTDTLSASSKFHYLGSFRCKVCHYQNTGNQYGDWLRSRHYQSYRSLLGESERLKIVMKKYDISRPEQDKRCLRCHTTGGQKLTVNVINGKEYKNYQGVGCESCHGPASGYIDPLIHLGTGSSVENRRAMKIKHGMWPVLGDSSIGFRERMCMRCHKNERLCRVEGTKFVDISVPAVSNYKHDY